MQCPIDSTTLLITDRQGIEIDYCPQCRGVWLDRGELDKLIQRGEDDSDRDDRGRSDRGRESHQPAKKKKKGWLSEVFEME